MTNGSKYLNANVAQNAEIENDDGFDRWIGNGDGSKRRNGWVMMAPNAETGNVDGSERWLRSDDERQTENSDGYECQNWEAMMALNAKLKIVMMALNAKLKIVTALNAKTEKRWWL